MKKEEGQPFVQATVKERYFHPKKKIYFYKLEDNNGKLLWDDNPNGTWFSQGQVENQGKTN
jgi:hypothetical protein